MVSPNKEAAAWQEAYDNLFRENEQLKRDIRVYLAEAKLILEPEESRFSRFLRMRSIHEWLWRLLPDKCEMHGCCRKGVRGNESVVGGVIMCDYCHTAKEG